MQRCLEGFYRLPRPNHNAGLVRDARDESRESRIEAGISSNGEFAVYRKAASRSFNLYGLGHKRRDVGEQSGRSQETAKQKTHSLYSSAWNGVSAYMQGLRTE